MSQTDVTEQIARRTAHGQIAVDELETTVSGIQTAASTLAGRVTAAEGDIADVQTDVSDLTDRVGAAENTIDDHETRLDAIENA